MTYYHHCIDYPDGNSIQGKLDHRGEPDFLDLDVTDRRVLDVATNDGFFAFWAEQYGASKVVAIDVDTYDKYEWGFSGPPLGWDSLGQQNKAAAFWEHHKAMSSGVEKLCLSVNELDPEKHGEFDVIINYGLLYHLRYPLMSLDRCRAVCTGMLVVETQVMNNYFDVPINLQAGRFTGMLGITDYSWPSEAMVAAWLATADFEYVFIQNRETKRSPTRQRFIACVNDEYAAEVEQNTNFHRADFDVIKKAALQLRPQG